MGICSSFNKKHTNKEQYMKSVKNKIKYEIRDLISNSVYTMVNDSLCFFVYDAVCDDDVYNPIWLSVHYSIKNTLTNNI